MQSFSATNHQRANDHIKSNSADSYSLDIDQYTGQNPSDSAIPFTQSPPKYDSRVSANNDDANPTQQTTTVTNNNSILQARVAHNQLNAALNVSNLSPGGLHIRTDIAAPPIVEHGVEADEFNYGGLSDASMPRRTLSHRSILHSTARSLSPASVLSSPQLAAMADMTPLPSPIGIGKDPWKMSMRSRSRASSTASNRESITSSTTNAATTQASPPRRKPYNGLRQPSIDPVTTSPPNGSGKEEGSRRSISDYVPSALSIPKVRAIAVSGSGGPDSSPQSALHREEYLAEQRGLSTPVQQTSASSQKDGNTVDIGSEDLNVMANHGRAEIYTATSIATGHLRRYQVVKFLGQGTFSKVFLAVKQGNSFDDRLEYSIEGMDIEGVKARSQHFVAIKVVEHGPAGGADGERVEVSLRREVELLKSINHPSLVHLHAFGSQEHRALLVLNFCPGGDLFELASTKLDLLVPSLVQRIFAELVSAVRYLHQNYIVHRDIKLENVLLNIPSSALPQVSNWQTYDRAIVTLTDLGLSRRMPAPPESPLLTTRCGSEDYAAPEILMGQPYDGRQTDAWALGVMLYALMEGRLPFDPLPGTRGDPIKLRARTPHRIARCEWAWYKFGDEDGEWDAEKGKDFKGAEVCVDGLLKRTSRRKDLAAIEQMEWVKNGIQVAGGLQRDDDAF